MKAHKMTWNEIFREIEANKETKKETMEQYIPMKNIRVEEIVFDDSYSTRYEIHFEFMNAPSEIYSRAIIDYQKKFDEYSLFNIEYWDTKNEYWELDDTISPSDRIQILRQLMTLKGLL